jgi:hypothetical protein
MSGLLWCSYATGKQQGEGREQDAHSQPYGHWATLASRFRVATRSRSEGLCQAPKAGESGPFGVRRGPGFGTVGSLHKRRP